MVGANTAFVGFTGATGGATSTQQIQNFPFANAPAAVPEPSPWAMLFVVLGGTVVMLRRRKLDAPTLATLKF